MSLVRLLLMIVITSMVACTVNPLPLPLIDVFHADGPSHIAKLDKGATLPDGISGADATPFSDMPSMGDLDQPSLDGPPGDATSEGGPHHDGPPDAMTDGGPADATADGGPADAPQE